MATYKLKRTETGSKSGKFHYQVIDESGKIISERKSNREYVACTIDGELYFGRLDLIGKGEHGRKLNYYKSLNYAEVYKYYLQNMKRNNQNALGFEEWAAIEQKRDQERLAELRTIAYL